MHHELKILPAYFEQVILGNKPFEIRDNSDRDFQERDIIILREFDRGHYTGRQTHRRITFVTDYAQQPGFVVFGMKSLNEEDCEDLLDANLVTSNSKTPLQEAIYKPKRRCLFLHRWTNTVTIGRASYSTCRDCEARKGTSPQDELLDIAWVISGGRAPMGEMLNNANPAKEGTA